MSDRLRDLATRIYRDIVQRRSTVRIHQATWEQTMPRPPAFLLGLYRSGTTPLRYSLGMHSLVAAPPESDFLVPFLQALQDERGLSGLTDLGYDEQHVLAAYRASADYFLSNYARSTSSACEVLIDKSPRYVEFASELAKLFPESPLVLLTRHPLSQIGSATRFGKMRPQIPDFPPETARSLVVDAAHYWHERTATLLDLQTSLNNPRRVTLVRYEDLCVDSKTGLSNVLDLLSLPWEETVLRYDGKTADRGREGAKALAHTGFQPSKADPRSGWAERDGEALDQIWPIVESTASRIGYTRTGF